MMDLISFKNTHDQQIYINPQHVVYVARFEDQVTVIALAIPHNGSHFQFYVRGPVEQVRQKLLGPQHGRG